MKFKMQRKLSYKSYGNDLKIFGYASVFNFKDKDGDVVLPGAFYRCLGVKKFEVKLLWQHIQEIPLGKILEIKEDTNGLYLEAIIFGNLEGTATPKKMIIEGVVDSFSIGYTVLDHFFDRDTRYLKELNLFEVSVVTFPANDAAKLKIAT